MRLSGLLRPVLQRDPFKGDYARTTVRGKDTMGMGAQYEKGLVDRRRWGVWPIGEVRHVPGEGGSLGRASAISQVTDKWVR